MRDVQFIEQYTFESNGKMYECFKFLDLLTLKILVGTNLTQEELVQNKVYKAKLIVKSYGGQDKIRISEISSK